MHDTYSASVLLMFSLIQFQKKAENLPKEKDCAIVRKWTKSMINHIYWSAVSTTNGSENMILAKWLSLVNYINSNHVSHSPTFPKCLKPELYSPEKK